VDTTLDAVRGLSAGRINPGLGRQPAASIRRTEARPTARAVYVSGRIHP
jgi:hypothetical protein